jgi:hypothetical protein
MWCAWTWDADWGCLTQMTATNFNLVLTSIDREPIYKIDQSFFVSLYWSFKIDRPIIWVLKKLTNPEEIKKTIVDFWDKCETENVAAICVNRIDLAVCIIGTCPRQQHCHLSIYCR